MPTTKPQFTIVIDEDLLEEVEDFRFSKRFPNRSQAINYLIREGIKAVKEQDATKR